jgi:photosystem II stability/assembly factor-like uncharacterized protein
MMPGHVRLSGHVAVAVCVGLLLWARGLPAAAVGQGPSQITLDWRSVGIGGGGGMFDPAISPHNARLLFIACDMGGIYRSSDGGHSWRMIDGYQARKAVAPPVFDPRNPDIVYLAVRGGIKRSRDAGITWEHIAGRFDPKDPDMPTALAVDPADPSILWAAFDTYLGQKGNYLVHSSDGGATWARHPGWRQRDRSVQKIFFAPAGGSAKQWIFLWSDGSLLRSDDDGAAWRDMTQGLPRGGPWNDCAAAWDPISGGLTLYVTLPTILKGNVLAGGVYTSKDAGETWRRSAEGLPMLPYQGKLPQYQLLALSPRHPNIVYVSSKGAATEPPAGSTVWRSADGGKSWQAVLFGEPRWPSVNVEPDWLTLELSWWWGGTALGLACNPGNPDDLIFTDLGRAIRSTDGGKHWYPLSSAKVDPAGRAWQGRGLEVSTSYQYYFDPFDRKRAYITYTDFGLARSLDGGRSWIWAGHGSPWTNTCYELAFDPDRRGVVFGAWSAAHDLPHWKMIRSGSERIGKFHGGLNRSDDSCATWRPLESPALPDAAATSIALDKNSPPHMRTLYAGFFGKGVYKSADDGRHWKPMNNGLGTPGNNNIWRLELHRDGTLLCAETLAYVQGRPVAGGLFRSRDGARSWQRIATDQPLPYIWGVRMDPRDSDTIYVAAFDVPPPEFKALSTLVPWPRTGGGGVYKSVNGGRTWRKILDEPWCWDVTIDWSSPNVIYAGTYWGGVYRSADGGNTWVRLAGLPFVCPQRVSIDPVDPRNLYVSTFGGGVWNSRLPEAPK